MSLNKRAENKELDARLRPSEELFCAGKVQIRGYADEIGCDGFFLLITKNDCMVSLINRQIDGYMEEVISRGFKDTLVAC